MGTATYIPLANVTLASSASSVSFSSISQAYRDLVLVVTGKTTAAGAWFICQFNGDTATNYNYVSMYGNGSTATSLTEIGNNYIYLASYDGTNASTAVANIMDYSATNKHKTVLIRGNNSGDRAEARASRWASTSAITSVVIKNADATNILTGTTLALYGIAS